MSDIARRQDLWKYWGMDSFGWGVCYEQNVKVMAPLGQLLSIHRRLADKVCRKYTYALKFSAEPYPKYLIGQHFGGQNFRRTKFSAPSRNFGSFFRRYFFIGLLFPHTIHKKNIISLKGCFRLQDDQHLGVDSTHEVIFYETFLSSISKRRVRQLNPIYPGGGGHMAPW